MEQDDRTGQRRPDLRRGSRHAEADRERPARDDLQDDLRYEGPIVFEDEQADAGGPGDGADGGGKVFLTAIVIGALVVLLVGIALVRRSGDAPRPVVPGTPPAPRVSRPADTDLAAPASGTAAPLGIADTEPATPPPAGDDAALPQGTGDGESVDEDAPSVPPTAPVMVPPAPTRAVPQPEPEPAPQRVVERAPAPKPAPKPAPAVEPATGAGGDVASAAATGLARIRANRRGFGLQVVYACREETVERALAQGGRKLLVVPDRKASCYRLLWGTYPSRDAALAAVADVPAYFTKGGTPRPVALADIAR